MDYVGDHGWVHGLGRYDKAATHLELLRPRRGRTTADPADHLHRPRLDGLHLAAQHGPLASGTSSTAAVRRCRDRHRLPGIGCQRQPSAHAGTALRPALHPEPAELHAVARPPAPVRRQLHLLHLRRSTWPGLHRRCLPGRGTTTWRRGPRVPRPLPGPLPLLLRTIAHERPLLELQPSGRGGVLPGCGGPTSAAATGRRTTLNGLLPAVLPPGFGARAGASVGSDHRRREVLPAPLLPPLLRARASPRTTVLWASTGSVPRVHRRR